MKQQNGGALILLLILLVLGISTWLIQAFNANQIQAQRQARTAAALYQAKQALLGYALIYGETHANEAYGFLPCPDLDGSNGQGSSSLHCYSRNVSLLGRLPWKSFELDAIRDGYAECLWYAVSGNFKSNPKTELMNWDTQGQLRIYQTDGVTLLAENIAAIIAAPNGVLTGQTRNGNTSICNGNYDVSNYLEGNNANINASPNTISNFTQGSITQTINDQLIYITTSEIYKRIKQRNDFANFINQLINTASNCTSSPVNLNFSNFNETTSTTQTGVLTIGRIRKSCLASPLHNWQDHLFYGKCSDGSSCVNVNGNNCKAVVIFAGERNATQNRQQKNDISNYLEEPVLSAFNTGANTFNGTASYTPSRSSEDVLACVH